MQMKIQTMVKKLRSNLAQEDSGLTTVEYIIILVLIAVLAIGVWRTFGSTVRSQVTSANSSVGGLYN